MSPEINNYQVAKTSKEAQRKLKDVYYGEWAGDITTADLLTAGFKEDRMLKERETTRNWIQLCH